MKNLFNQAFALAMLTATIPAAAQEDETQSTALPSNYVFLYDNHATSADKKYLVCDARTGTKYSPSDITQKPEQYVGNQRDFITILVNAENVILKPAGGDAYPKHVVVEQIKRSRMPVLLKEFAIKKCL